MVRSLSPLQEDVKKKEAIVTLRGDAMALRKKPGSWTSNVIHGHSISAYGIIFGQIELFGLLTLTCSKWQLLLNITETSRCDNPLAVETKPILCAVLKNELWKIFIILYFNDENTVNTYFGEAFWHSSECLFILLMWERVKCQIPFLPVSRPNDRIAISTASFGHSKQLSTILGPNIYLIESEFSLPGFWRSVRILICLLEDI